MLYFSKQLTKNYFVDLMMFYKLRNFSDGISFFEFKTNLDLYEHEHNPRFDLHLIILNYTILELEFYKM